MGDGTQGSQAGTNPDNPLTDKDFDYMDQDGPPDDPNDPSLDAGSGNPDNPLTDKDFDYMDQDGPPDDVNDPDPMPDSDLQP